MSKNRPAVIHYRRPLGTNLCGRTGAGGPDGVANNNHARARTTCKACLRLLSGTR
ncbi:MAG: hypothetical protein KDE32_10055 [Novosphingobium sp.]|nr:hypothetical protein [Novosphingobium sp.]